MKSRRHCPTLQSLSTISPQSPIPKELGFCFSSGISFALPLQYSRLLSNLSIIPYRFFHKTVIARFEKKGLSGLQEGERPGRPTVLDVAVRWKLEKDLRRSPHELKYSQNLWDGKLLSYHLTEKYGVDLGVRQCQRLFTQMGFRRRKPRPLIAHGDPVMQLAYKKTPSHGTKSKD